MKGEWLMAAGGLIAFFVYQHHQNTKGDAASDKRLKLRDEYNAELWATDIEQNEGKQEDAARQKKQREAGTS